VQEERYRRRHERPDPTLDAIAQYNTILKHGWEVLEKIDNPKSYNIPAILNAISNAQKRKDEIMGVDAPRRLETRTIVDHLDLTNLSSEELNFLEEIVARNDRTEGQEAR
jgi:hypothetical protein